MRRQLLIILLAVVLIVAVAIYFGTRGTLIVSKKTKVAASFYPLAEFARQVGRGHVDVVSITPGGVEPHDFEPTAQQIRQVFSAQVFLFNGAGFDPWADKIARETADEGIVTRELSSYFPLRKEAKSEGEEEEEEEEEHEGEGLDPHIWLDPVLAQKEVRIIRDALIKADPKNAEDYRRNASAYTAELGEVDRAYRNGLRRVRTRELVSSHAAFGYLARRYNLRVFPIAVSPSEEPSPRRIGEISRLVELKKIKYIFFETLVSPKVAETIAREAGAKTLVFNPIEGLTPKEAARGENYISLMRKNLKNLQLALEGR